MALLLCLGLTAALARGCLHCHSNFSEKFSFYRHHVNLKSWWVGDIPVSGSLLTDWGQDTMKELHLAIPAEITREKLNQVANAVYQKMDQLYQGKMYFPGYFPNELRAIFREQVHLIQNAIIESRIDCQRHCGIFQYQTISCTNCTDSHVICFGYNCESSVQWETAVQGLLLYINKWHKYVSFIRGRECALSPRGEDTDTSDRFMSKHQLPSSRGRTEPLRPCEWLRGRLLISPSFTCLEPPHLANLTLENASECLTQH
ncbi:izumo sperm-egg fusion protein 4 isoform X8 [Mustela erminea]|uniref:izumo sperm-egg fusion protein 4 isoform X8 n=1 Tax=Mustela erminea TaxID=36723 RepID=UPI0013867E4E|nr:izumo sperm-egg fusion protein 4 isoform X8 [Mustela erminea]XP_032214856.1 izumo sperm-egg fusion protein 4 isoform X8 [Mustela erminea]